ncbi:dTDP-4-amino-4,6-dideoxygalactose transaminase [Belnapia sp. F-4-1]|uniref:dTDP-4-amino-4,6-dideoxygalactose transaminase n=1 Tax=Belnapia sp. F-4-1 TaxID=1545443 RepID=UPI0005B9524F|nr:dTDP-4-amino-4,6-dideoxygalactose transaminase [Belnapia sp. F-4-1]
MPISFNQPTLIGLEFRYLAETLERAHLSGNGEFTKRCQHLLEQQLGAHRVLLTHSATGALEMAAILAGIGPGDEVIMPSFTFCSTANAIVLRGGVPVFAEIRPDTLNIDETAIETAITPRTRAICVVHYAGVGCQMDTVLEIANRHGLVVIEDAAQALHADFKDRPLGTFGALSAFSFHETKNIISGEGGALVINDLDLAERAEIIWEKGTNRAQFQRGEVARYTWVDIGSSFLPSELTAAFLFAQLEAGASVTRNRLDAWQRYHAALRPLEIADRLRRPVVPQGCAHNGHIYYVLAPDGAQRDAALRAMAARGVNAVMHYVPLHSSPAGLRYGRAAGPLPITEDLASRLIRLPLHAGLMPEHQEAVVAALEHVLA